jgi:two-component system, cell cycle response regulator CtrA
MARRAVRRGHRPDGTYLDRISPLSLTLYLPSALIIASSLESKAASRGQHGGENVGYHRNSTACDVKHVGEEWELGMRVLLIEDDSATAQSIELMLKSEGFNVYTTDLGEEGIDLGKVYDYDIILLDLNLPDMSGFEVLRSLRVSKVKTPILILSGFPGIEDKVRGLGFGADDYMTKPFHKDELVARIHAIVRRSKGHAHSVIETGDLVVSLDTKTVEVNGARVHLTRKEYQMLELLSLRKGTTLTKEMFLNHLYGGMDEPELKIIDVFTCKLRKKLANASNGKNYIETVWGRGYVLREPVETGAKIPA